MIIILEVGFYLCIYKMYICSACLKVRRFSYKTKCKVFGLSKGWCVFFYYFGTVLKSVVCLLLICTVCWIYLYFHFCCEVALAWIFPYLGMNPGHLFHNLNQLLWHMIGALGSIFVLSWVKHNAARWRKRKLNGVETFVSAGS